MEIIHILMGTLTAEVTGRSIKDCLMAFAKQAEAGWAVEQITVICYKGTDEIQYLEVWFAGGGQVWFEHMRNNLYHMTHI
jgi:hypothetical protein